MGRENDEGEKEEEEEEEEEDHLPWDSGRTMREKLWKMYRLIERL